MKMSKTMKAGLVIIAWITTAVLIMALNAPHGVLLITTFAWYFILGYTMRGK
jgi:hypothetical protein